MSTLQFFKKTTRDCDSLARNSAGRRFQRTLNSESDLQRRGLGNSADNSRNGTLKRLNESTEFVDWKFC